jgi:hypothetical protein
MALRSKDQRTEKVKPSSFATKIYSNLQVKSAHPIDGWSPERKGWGEIDHRARGATSPLGGQVKRRK